jgi:6-phosphogluconolactonase
MLATTALGLAAPAPPRRRPGTLGVFLGTYTEGTASRGIYRATFDPATGTLADLEVDAMAANPSFLALHPSGKFLYAVAELAQFDGKEEGGVRAYTLDADGKIDTKIGEYGSKGTAPCHLAVHPSGKGLIVANYGTGTVSVFTIADDGALGPLGVVFQPEKGSGADPARQEGPHAHCVRFDPSGAFVLEADLGADRVFTHRFDPADAKAPLRVVHETPTAPGSGPRHLAFHPSGRFVFVNEEMSSTVTAYRFDPKTGALEPLETLSTLPPGGHPGNSTAETVVHPSGRFVYVSNRGHDSIARFRFDPETARLEALGQTPTRGQVPRNFNLDPSGRWLLAANQGSGNVAVFRVDPGSGGLEPAGDPVPVPAPVCILFHKRG